MRSKKQIDDDLKAIVRRGIKKACDERKANPPKIDCSDILKKEIDAVNGEHKWCESMKKVADIARYPKAE